MKIKTSELTGAALDWAVAKCEGVNEEAFNLYYTPTEPSDLDTNGYPEFHYSTIWAQGGPIIEREDINVNHYTYSEVTEFGQEIYRKDGWTAFTTVSAYWMTPKRAYGPTSLIAAMRCYVMIHFGDEIEIPQELFE